MLPKTLCQQTKQAICSAYFLHFLATDLPPVGCWSCKYFSLEASDGGAQGTECVTATYPQQGKVVSLLDARTVETGDMHAFKTEFRGRNKPECKGKLDYFIPTAGFTNK